MAGVLTGCRSARGRRQRRSPHAGAPPPPPRIASPPDPSPSPPPSTGLLPPTPPSTLGLPLSFRRYTAFALSLSRVAQALPPFCAAIISSSVLISVMQDQVPQGRGDSPAVSSRASRIQARQATYTRGSRGQAGPGTRPAGATPPPPAPAARHPATPPTLPPCKYFFFQ